MDENSRKILNEHYSRQLEKYGKSIAAISYKTLEQQQKRFQILTDIGKIPNNATVLDVGCGLAHLCDFLRASGWNGHYTGIDINQQFIAINKKRLLNDEFLCLDLLKDEFNGKFDYVFCAATLQHRPPFCDPELYLKEMIKKLFELSKICFSFDVFSSRVDYMDEGKLYIKPEKLLNFCYSLTSRLVLRNDYRPFEIMVYLYKQIQRDKYNIFNCWEGKNPYIS